MKFLITFGFLAILLPSSLAFFNENEIFTEFLIKFNISINFNEYEARKEIFMENFHKIQAHNQRYLQGRESYRMGFNHFSHLTLDEISRRSVGVKIIPEYRRNYATEDFTFMAPESYDWRSQQKVSPIQDQGQCGSCYAFSSIAAVESQMLIKYGKYTKLSEQEAMECTRGCGGGYQEEVYQYTFKYNGGTPLSSYPYQAQVINQCSPGNRQRVPSSKVSQILSIPKGESNMINYLVKNGPLDVSMKIYGSFYNYNGGIYSSYGESLIGYHAVLIVGYGSSGSSKYWIIKNSWGNYWGEKGYLRLLRGNDNCGVESLQILQPQL